MKLLAILALAAVAACSSAPTPPTQASDTRYCPQVAEDGTRFYRRCAS